MSFFTHSKYFIYWRTVPIDQCRERLLATFNIFIFSSNSRVKSDFRLVWEISTQKVEWASLVRTPTSSTFVAFVLVVVLLSSIVSRFQLTACLLGLLPQYSVLNSAGVCMFTTLIIISSFSSIYFMLFKTVPSVLITTDATVIFIFFKFFIYLAKVWET